MGTPNNVAQSSKRSAEAVEPPPLIDAGKLDVIVEDPMRDGAVFNQPIDDGSLQAQKAPVLEKQQSDSSVTDSSNNPLVLNTSNTSPAESRTSLDSRVSSNEELGAQSQKRQPHRLAKIRGHHESTSEQRDENWLQNRSITELMITKAVPETTTSERPRGVLTKKDRLLKGTDMPSEDAEGTGSMPLAVTNGQGREESASKKSSSL